MIRWMVGTVRRIRGEAEGVQEIEVESQDGVPARAVHYTDVLPPLREGEAVLLNATAEHLKLGTGGYHYVYASLREEAMDTAAELRSEDALGHIMKLRYTPLQRAVLAAEEEASPYHALFTERRSLSGMPVLICELHSMVPVIAAWVHYASQRPDSGKQLRLAYIMTDGGALPIVFSRHCRLMKELGYVTGTITYGHAYGGDLETVNKYTALLAAKHILQADLAIAAMGPGIVGTGTWLGHTGMETGELVNAVHTLGGEPIVVPRISFADPRSRHYGLSHHTMTALTTAALTRAVVPMPAALPSEQLDCLMGQIRDSGLSERHTIDWIDGITTQQAALAMEQYPAKITTMGRGLADDPAFFLTACAAAEYVSRRYVTG